MNEGTFEDLIARCPFRSIIGRRNADLLGPAGVIIAIEEPNAAPSLAEISSLQRVLRDGGTVLVMATQHEDRERLLRLLRVDPARRLREWGRA